MSAVKKIKPDNGTESNWGAFVRLTPWGRPRSAWEGRFLSFPQLRLVSPDKPDRVTVMNSIQISRRSGLLSQTFRRGCRAQIYYMSMFVWICNSLAVESRRQAPNNHQSPLFFSKCNSVLIRPHRGAVVQRWCWCKTDISSAPLPAFPGRSGFSSVTVFTTQPSCSQDE